MLLVEGVVLVVVAGPVSGNSPMVIDDTKLATAFVLSVSWKVTKAVLPDIIGVPETTPSELSDSPAGNFPETIFQMYGATPPVAAMVCE